MPTALIHIGYPKTASTWLQKRLLPQYEDILLLRRATPGAGWIEAAARLPTAEFEPAACRAEFEASVAASGSRIPVVSYEAFVGDPFGGGGLSPDELANRVCSVLPKARIAMVVREPVALLESLYRQYVQIGGLERPEVALFGRGVRTPVLSPEFAHFDRMYEIWAGHFGPSCVKVFVYEELLEDPRGFVDAFVAFAGATPTNEGLPPAGVNRGTAGLVLSVLRLANRFAHSRFNAKPWLPAGWIQQKWARRILQRGVSPLLRGTAGGQHVFEESARGELREHFRPHNRALEEATGLDLGRFGYSR